MIDESDTGKEATGARNPPGKSSKNSKSRVWSRKNSHPGDAERQNTRPTRAELDSCQVKARQFDAPQCGTREDDCRLSLLRLQTEIKGRDV